MFKTVIIILLLCALAIVVYFLVTKKCDCDKGKGGNTTTNASVKCFGKENDSSGYECPDTNGTILTSVTLPWGGVSVKFSKSSIQWDTPTGNIVNFVSKELYGPVLSVLHTTGSCTTSGDRPAGTFYMCGPLQGINGKACGGTCGPNSSANYSGTGWDQGHMVSNHEGGLFAGGEQQTFSMCNIWPQGKQFNEEWWQHLEYTCDNYAIDKECLIMSGPIFANGTDTCMGSFSGRASSKTTGPTVSCSSARPTGAPESPIPVPSNFFKILVDLKKKIYWAFLTTNDAGPVKQLVPDMLSTLEKVNGMTGIMATVDLSGYEEQHNVACVSGQSSANCSTTSNLTVVHTAPKCT